MTLYTGAVSLNNAAFAFFNSCASGNQIVDVCSDISLKLFSGGYSGRIEAALFRTPLFNRDFFPELFDFINTSSVVPFVPLNLRKTTKRVEPVRLADMNYGVVAIRGGSSEASSEYLNEVLKELYSRHELGKIFASSIVCQKRPTREWDFYADRAF